MRFFVGLILGGAMIGLAYQFLMKKDNIGSSHVTQKYQEAKMDLEQIQVDQQKKINMEDAGIIDPGFNYQPQVELKLADMDKEMVHSFREAIVVSKNDLSLLRLKGEYSGPLQYEHGPLKGRSDFIKLKLNFTENSRSFEIVLLDPAAVEYFHKSTENENNLVRANKKLENAFFLELDEKQFLYLDYSDFPKISGRLYSSSIGMVELSQN